MAGALDRLDALLANKTRSGPTPTRKLVKHGKQPKRVEIRPPTPEPAPVPVVKSGDVDLAVKAEHIKTITNLQEASEMTLPEWCEVVRTECVDLEARLRATCSVHSVGKDQADDLVERAINKVKADAFETIVLNQAEGL